MIVPHPTMLYADTTIYHVNQIENLFTEFIMDHLLIWPGTVLPFS
jgi:hypothetical protein